MFPHFTNNSSIKVNTYINMKMIQSSAWNVSVYTHQHETLLIGIVAICKRVCVCVFVVKIAKRSFPQNLTWWVFFFLCSHHRHLIVPYIVQCHLTLCRADKSFVFVIDSFVHLAFRIFETACNRATAAVHSRHRFGLLRPNPDQGESLLVLPTNQPTNQPSSMPD